MAITEKTDAFVDTTATQIALSQMFTTTASSSNPAYLVLTALDRNEYTAGSSKATGTLVGNGHVLSFSSIGSDGRGAGIVFTYQASTGRYYNSTYGYLDQLTYDSSGSASDVTNLSLFGTNNLSLATSDAANAYSMMQADPSGYIGSATVVTQGSFTGTVPTQATPDSSWPRLKALSGKSGTWTAVGPRQHDRRRGRRIAAGAETDVGPPGKANGEWIVAFNGPSGASGNWQSLVKAGEIIVIETSDGGGHITTCVSGSGSSAMLVDNATYEGYNGQIENSANDGSAADIVISPAHAASQEWSGVPTSSVVIYELDTPTVTASGSATYLPPEAASRWDRCFLQPILPVRRSPSGRSMTRPARMRSLPMASITRTTPQQPLWQPHRFRWCHCSPVRRPVRTHWRCEPTTAATGEIGHRSLLPSRRRRRCLLC